MPWQGQVLKQTHQQSCGYCCVGMVANLIDKRKDAELSIVAVGKGLDAYAYDRAARDRVGAVQTPIVHAAFEQHGRVPHWGSGTYGNHLAEVLRKGFQINALYRGGQSPKTAMRVASAQRPVIILVHWNGGGGHWVVVVGRQTRGFGKASDYTILDPAGHVVVNQGSTVYKPPYGVGGTFANYFVTVQGRIPMPRGRKLPGM